MDVIVNQFMTVVTVTVDIFVHAFGNAFLNDCMNVLRVSCACGFCMHCDRFCECAHNAVVNVFAQACVIALRLANLKKNNFLSYSC